VLTHRRIRSIIV